MNSKQKQKQKSDLLEGIVKWQAPSNIAIVKYWGKVGNQEPINPSISFTLTNSYTTTSVSYLKKDEATDKNITFLFEGVANLAFEKRVFEYLQTLNHLLPFLANYQIRIDSSNSFPHSSGIASSASSMAALSLCLASIQQNLDASNRIAQNDISNLARLGSGSGCRSVAGKWNIWGKTPDFIGSSNLYSTEISDIDPIFNTLCDTILIIDPTKKKTSSTAGHALMNNHPFKEARIKQANQNVKALLEALKLGDLESFIQITENEALTLHGLMFNSNPSYTLMLPQTLEAINKIRDFRAQTHLPICFTLDAGPNIHLIYPQEISTRVTPFIENELLPLCYQNKAIFDKIGNGAKELTI